MRLAKTLRTYTLSLTLCAALIAPITINAAASDNKKRDKKELEHEVKKWALDHVKKSFELSYENYQDRKTLDRSYFTYSGCIGFIHTLHNYRLYGFFDSINEKTTAKIWEMVKYADTPAEHVTIQDSFKNKNNLYHWKIHVPIILEVSRKYRDYEIKHLASIKVQETGNPNAPFKIDRWYTKQKGADFTGRQPIRNSHFWLDPKEKRPECSKNRELVN